MKFEITKQCLSRSTSFATDLKSPDIEARFPAVRSVNRTTDRRNDQICDVSTLGSNNAEPTFV